MRIGFIGNTNNYPFILARALRRQGHDVVVVIDRPEPLDRPETRYADIPFPYPGWIREVPAIEYEDIVYATARWRATLDVVRDCDALVLNKLAYDAATRLDQPAFCLTTEGDIENWAHPSGARAYCDRIEGRQRDTRWIRAAFHLPSFGGPHLRAWMDLTPSPLNRWWHMYLFRRVVERQRAGLRRAVAISAFPDDVSLPLAEVMRDCLAPDARRLCLLMADTRWITPTPPPNNSVLRLFNSARVLWQEPFPPLVGSWENKGTDILLRGVALWHQRTGRAIDLRLVEKGLSVTATKALVAELGLQRFVTWRPEMSQREVFEEYARADAVVEQLGKHVLGMAGYEAMAAGRPVLANGRPEIFVPVLGEAPPVAQARTPEEVAEQLDRLADPSERARIADAGRRFVQVHLNPDTAATVVAEILTEAIARRRRTASPSPASPLLFNGIQARKNADGVGHSVCGVGLPQQPVGTATLSARTSVMTTLSTVSGLNEACSAAQPQRERVLVFRSCRMPQFRAAIAHVRAADASTEVWALTHDDFKTHVMAAGAHHAVTLRPGRFGAWRLGPVLLWRLYRLRFDSVVVPLMDADIEAAANLLRLAALLTRRRVVICPDGKAVRVHQRGSSCWLAITATVLSFDTAVTLGLLLRAVFRRRHKPAALAEGSRRRVLHIINSLALGGTQVQFAELLNRTPPDEFDVAVLVLANNGDFSKRRLRRDDVPITYLDDGLRDGAMVAAIAEHCRRGRYDIVHTWLPLPNMLGSAAARLAGVPCVITSVRSLNPSYCPHYAKWWYRIGDVIASRLADVITVNARPLVADHARWALVPARRIDVVHNGVDPSVLRENVGASRASLRDALGLAPDTLVIGTVGRLAIEKDQATFVRALAVLRREGLALRGVIVGDGPCEDPLRELVRDLGMETCVTFLGARQDARRLIAGFDVLALTSRVEGFPNVLLEAALLGVPVASSDVGGVADVIDEPESLFPAGDAEAAAAVLRDMLCDRERALARAARRRSRCEESFTADRMAARWLSLYRRVLNDRQHGLDGAACGQRAVATSDVASSDARPFVKEMIRED